MPRANRHYIPGGVWHITHRCHNREFLLRSLCDRQRWKYWLFQARKRFGISVLNYIVTSNHIHILVRDSGQQVIARSMQLIAGRLAQEYNTRMGRSGAFWEGRYFATAISTDYHLFQCLIYIDLNMVRAGMVTHPSHWKVCGYNDLQHQPLRYRVMDYNALYHLGGFLDGKTFRCQHHDWVEQELDSGLGSREHKWTLIKSVS